jgi:hypothetical protein
MNMKYRARFFMLIALLQTSLSPAFASRTGTYVQVVKQAQTSVGVQPSDNPVAPSQSVKFDATISPLRPTIPTGTIEFVATGTQTSNRVTSGPLPLNLSGTATWNTSLPVADQFAVVASYTGDSNYLASASIPVTETVQLSGSPDFTLGLPTSISVVHGQSFSTLVSITALNGFHGTVTFSCDGAPANSTCIFANGTVVIPAMTAGTSSAPLVATTLTITTAATTVTTVGAFLFLFGFGGLKRKRRSHIVVAAVALLCLVVSLAGCADPNRYVQANGTPLGSYPLTITAKSGSISHTTKVTLNVVAQ